MLRTAPAIALLAVLFGAVLAQDSSAADRALTRAGGAQTVRTYPQFSRGDRPLGTVNPLSEGVLYSFRSGADGAAPLASLIAGSGGAFYGTTAGGGAITGGSGIVYKLVPVGSGYNEEILYRFHGRDGAQPYAPLLIDRTGALYGTTFGGGSFGLGTVFKLTPNGTSYDESVLYNFQGGADGSSPHASLIADSTGSLYGTTALGGPAKAGTVFKLTPNGNSYSESVLYSFQNGADGTQPFASLLTDPTGALYGTTVGGGSAGQGTVFKLTPNGNGYSESILYSFQGGADGVFPFASLISDSAGALYGTTFGGGSAGHGIVFKLAPNGNVYNESIIYTFQPGIDGACPYGSLIADSTGSLYGTTVAGGGKLPFGTVFKLTPSQSGYNESVLYRFPGGSDGSNPYAALTIDNTGALYGTTYGNFSNRPNDGSVFKLTPNGAIYTESVVHSFHWQADGANPNAPLIGDPTGALYSTTSSGGAAGQGTVFKMIPKGNGFSESVIYRFQGKPDGASPVAGLIADNTGALYGTTQSGGIGDKDGTVFKLTPNGSGYSESVLYRFLGSPDGYAPLASLIADASGALYGTTRNGGIGKHGFGTVFKLTPNGNGYSESVLFRFGGSSGTYPTGALIEDNSGSLYGTTSGGGAIGKGTVFKLSRNGAGYSETILHSFGRHADGAFPGGGLIADNVGALYGTTGGGGSAGQGTVFKLTPNENSYSESALYSFQGGTDGGYPNGSLIADSTGAFYGTTAVGGTGGVGTVFKLAPIGSGYSKFTLYNFQKGSDGAYPGASLFADSTGTLYGTTEAGGKLRQGTIFRVVP